MDDETLLNVINAAVGVLGPLKVRSAETSVQQTSDGIVITYRRDGEAARLVFDRQGRLNGPFGPYRYGLEL